MRYAIISDVHANLEALTVALSLVRPDDQVVCLGDSVGYGPNPNECLDLLRAYPCVLGNHDAAAIGLDDLSDYNPAARISAEWTQRTLTAENRAFLESVPYELRMSDGTLFVHGSPGPDYFDYIFRKIDARRAFERTDAFITFVGHSHFPGAFKLDDDTVVEIDRNIQQSVGQISLSPRNRYIVNGGSIGQPRDKNPNPSMVFYEPELGIVTWVRFAYPIEVTQQKIRDAGLPVFNADRLAVGG